jgi:hypothetical protein
MRAYRMGGILLKLSEDSDPMAVAMDYIHTINSNIEMFLKNKTKKMEIDIEDIDRDFPIFWKLIDAEGDMDAALAEFNNIYNVRKMPQINKKANIVQRIVFKLKRLIVKLPGYIKDA